MLSLTHIHTSTRTRTFYILYAHSTSIALHTPYLPHRHSTAQNSTTLFVRAVRRSGVPRLWLAIGRRHHLRFPASAPPQWRVSFKTLFLAPVAISLMQCPTLCLVYIYMCIVCLCECAVLIYYTVCARTHIYFVRDCYGGGSICDKSRNGSSRVLSSRRKS